MENLKNLTDINDTSEEYLAGACAYRDLGRESECPYTDGPRRTNWLGGFIAEQSDEQLYLKRMIREAIQQ